MTKKAKAKLKHLFRDSARANFPRAVIKRSAARMAAPSIKFATSGSKSAFCLEPTDPPSLPVAKLRPW